MDKTLDTLESPEPLANHRRERDDRRRSPTSPWDAFRLRGRRLGPRRHEEAIEPHFTDRFETRIGILVLALLLLTILDGALTLHLLYAGSEELNPVMDHLLGHSQESFMIGKYVLTALGIPFLIVYRNFPVFHSKMKVFDFVIVFIMMYIMLALYQVSML